MAKKKAPPKSAPVAAPAPAAVVAEAQPPASFTPAEAKKLAKLVKASDRKKRLDAIRVVSENHAYIAKGGCLLPLLESLVAKKKMEEVVQAAGKVCCLASDTCGVLLLQTVVTTTTTVDTICDVVCTSYFSFKMRYREWQHTAVLL